MKFTTIWTMPACTVREKLHRTREWAMQRAAALLPAEVRYWAFIQSSVEAIDTMDPRTVVGDVRVLDALDALSGSHR